MSTHPIAAALLAHFDVHRRELPWRDTTDPYAILVSEVMLQQTRVDTVRDYYLAWMDRFPTIDHLAEADVDDVLLAWKGLGYYSRARNLHAAARLVRERHRGSVPADLAALRELPGVGEYTAGAVASIAHAVAVPAVDGNVRRVLSRLHDIPSPTAAELRRLASRLVPDVRPGDFNQALMELGATICTPRAPACGECPIAEWCRAREAGVQEQRPLPTKRAPLPERTVEVAVPVRGDGAVMLVRRPATGLLARMWEFPSPADHAWVREMVDRGEPVRELAPVRHVFSHVRVIYLPTLFRVDPGSTAGARPEPEASAWVPLHALDDWALPVAQQRIAVAARAVLDGPPGPWPPGPWPPGPWPPGP